MFKVSCCDCIFTEGTSKQDLVVILYCACAYCTAVELIIAACLAGDSIVHNIIIISGNPPHNYFSQAMHA